MLSLSFSVILPFLGAGIGTKASVSLSEDAIFSTLRNLAMGLGIFKALSSCEWECRSDDVLLFNSCGWPAFKPEILHMISYI